MPSIRVLLVDDHVLFRRGMASLLREREEFDVVGEAMDGREAIQKARELMPDVILMDISMPKMDGIEATRSIKQELPYLKIVMLSASEEESDLFEAIKSGAQGYLLKKIEPQELFAMLKGVVQGDAPISRAMAAKILGEFAHQARRTAEPSSPAANLSPREKEVLDLVTQGKSNKEIAAALAIAENTVKNHLKNILEKLHLENRVQAATYALREGLVEKTRVKPG